MSTDEERIAAFEKLVKQVARNVARDSRFVEIEDLEQELYLFVLQRGESLPLPQDANFSLKPLLTGHARMWAFRQRQAHFIISNQFSYRTSEVKKILSEVFDKSTWEGSSDSEESMEDRVASFSDVAWAIDRLEKKERDLLISIFRDGNMPSSTSKEYNGMQSAVIKLTNILNHYTRADEWEGPGRRTAMSNSSANSVLSREREGDRSNIKETFSGN